MNTIEELQHAHSLNKDQTNDVDQTSRDSIDISASGSAATNVTENDQREGDVVTSHGHVKHCANEKGIDNSQYARGFDAEGASKEAEQGWKVTLTDSSGRSSDAVSVSIISHCRSTTL